MMKNCLKCGVLFKVIAYRQNTAKYCSFICRGRSLPVSESTRQKISIAMKKVRFIPKIKKNCLICSKEYLVRKCHLKSKYCSHRCYHRSLVGKPQSIEARLNLSIKNGGSNHYNWQGGITPINLKIRRSLDYRIWRLEVFKRDNYTCQFCGTRGGDLHADHIKPFAYFPKLRFELSNGRTLCVNCHRGTETYGGRVAFI